MAKATAYNTNLASEFYVLSVLHRLGLNANLTLGNRKSVDIVVEKPDGAVITIDVKGMERKTSWWVNKEGRKDENHYMIYVSFLNKIEDISVVPESFIVPSTKVDMLSVTLPSGIEKLEYSTMKNSEFKEAWHFLI